MLYRIKMERRNGKVGEMPIVRLVVGGERKKKRKIETERDREREREGERDIERWR